MSLSTHPLGQERMAAHQPLPGINPADGGGGERRQQARTVQAGGIKLTYKMDLVKAQPRRAHLHLD